jgi:hypothetical protein
MTTQIEIKPAQKISDAVMDDCGKKYFTTFKYRLDGDVDLYGSEEWRTGRVVWATTESWSESNQEDESLACEWDEFEVQDESGEILPEYAAKEVKALL